VFVTRFIVKNTIEKRILKIRTLSILRLLLESSVGPYVSLLHVYSERSKTALVNASLAGKATDNGSLRDLKTIFGFDGDDSEEED
jgi:hypothetical protein